MSNNEKNEQEGKWEDALEALGTDVIHARLRDGTGSGRGGAVRAGIGVQDVLANQAGGWEGLGNIKSLGTRVRSTPTP